MTDTNPGPEESLAEQRLHLGSLKSFEERIRILREQECDLEAEHIAVQAALQSATSRFQPKIDPALALRIGRALEHRRELEERRREPDEDHSHCSPGRSRRVDQLRAGRAALQSWIDASRPQEAGAVVAHRRSTHVSETADMPG